jgi:hypothetical protein
MRHVTILILCLFLISISVFTFADDPTQAKQPEQKIEAVSEGELIKEARELPSTLMTDEEEHSRVMKEVEELIEGYRYEEDLSD